MLLNLPPKVLLDSPGAMVINLPAVLDEDEKQLEQTQYDSRVDH